MNVTKIPGIGCSNIESNHDLSKYQMLGFREIEQQKIFHYVFQVCITFILDITSVPEFILNYIRTAYSIKRVVLNLILDSSYISR